MELTNLIDQLLNEVQTMNEQELRTMISYARDILENAKIQKARLRKAMKEKELGGKPYCVVCCQLASKCKCGRHSKHCDCCAESWKNCCCWCNNCNIEYRLCRASCYNETN